MNIESTVNIGIIIILICCICFFIICFIETIIEKKNNKKIINNLSIGDKFYWHDFSLDNNPFETIKYFYLEIIDIKFDIKNRKWIKYEYSDKSQNVMLAEDFIKIYSKVI